MAKKETVTQYVTRFKKDVTKKTTRGPKLMNACIIGGVAVFFQFLTVHMLSLGISMDEVALLNVLLPILSFATMPIAGVISDKIGRPKLIVTVSALISAIFHLGLLAVPPREEGSPKGLDKTLVIYFVMRAISGIALPIVMMSTDGVVLNHCMKLKEDFGFQKFYGVLAACITPLVIGKLIDLTSESKENPNFSITFYFFTLTQLLCIAILPLLQTEDKKKDKKKDDNEEGDIKILIKNPAVLGYLGVMTVIGIHMVIVEVYLMAFLKDLGASNSLFGVRAAVGGLTGLPITFFTGFIMQKLGFPNILTSVLLFIAVRSFGHSIIGDAASVLPYETLEGYIFPMAMATASAYAVQLAPPHMVMSLQGVTMGIMMGLSRSLGSLFGGLFVPLIGYRSFFKLVGVLSAATGIFYIYIYNKNIKHLPIVYKKESAKKKKN